MVISPLFLLSWKSMLSDLFFLKGCDISALCFLCDKSTTVIVVRHQSLFLTEKILLRKSDLAHHGQPPHRQWVSKSSHCLCFLCWGMFSKEFVLACHFSVLSKIIYNQKTYFSIHSWLKQHSVLCVCFGFGVFFFDSFLARSSWWFAQFPYSGLFSQRDGSRVAAHAGCHHNLTFP